MTYKANVINIILPAPVIISQLCESINDDTHKHIEQNHNNKNEENHIIEESENEKPRISLEGHVRKDLPNASSCSQSLLHHEEEALHGGVAEDFVNCLSGGHFDDVVEVKEEGHVEVSDPHVEVDNETCEDKNCYHI